MPSKTGKTYSSFYPNDLAVNQSSGVGIDSTTRVIHDGLGQSTAISLSDDVLQVKPVNDNSVSTMTCQSASGNNILSVDTTNSKVLVGASQVAANTNYAYFGCDNGASAAFAADVHYGIPFVNSNSAAVLTNTSMGSSTSSSFNDTNPATTLTITTSAEYRIQAFWYVMDDITIDAVKWWHAADTATGDDTAAHLMSYTIDSANGSASGDLSSGVVVADGATITNAGNEQIYYQAMTVQSADVDAGKVILFTFTSDTINSDYSINATVKYHIR